ASEPSEAEPAREAAGEERPDQRRRRLHEEDRPVRGVGEPVRGLEHGAARRKAHDDEALHERRSVDRRDARDPRDSDASAHSHLLAAYAGAARSLPRSACNRRGGSGVPTGMKRLLFVVLAACGAHSTARPTLAPEVAELDLTVSDLARATDFFVDGLAFRPAGRGHVALGDQAVALHPHAGRAIPADSRSNDLWFEHMAIVVPDMDAAYARVIALGARPISAGPQTIPLSNPAAGGIRAFYFKDGDGHSLELIWYPSGKGDPRWQAPDGRLFLGIDHTAIAVADTERSLRFY